MENRSSIINAVKRHVNKVNKITKTKLNKETKAKLMQRVNRSICVFESLSIISLPSFGNPLEIDYFHSSNDFKLIFPFYIKTFPLVETPLHINLL